ncbi:MAG: hypothetical protein LQ352_007040 [Teloschistes flavicans]|nr:MAG: hypothetical protein LQ352_007040 [Teloschistes flavicans]
MAAPEAPLPAPEVFSKEDTKDELAALDALEKEASEFNKDAEIDRILKAFRLDAYAVLNLQPGVPDTQIKIQYRKLSLLIHPDKTSNPAAPTAFDRLKKAQTELMDSKHRTHLDECISDARMLLIRERKLTTDSSEVKEPNTEFLGAWRKKTVEVLVDAEARRRKQMKAQLQEEGREQRKVDEEVEQRKRRREHEVKWEESREGRIGSWRDFNKGKVGGKVEGTKGEGEGKKKKKLKVLG